MILVLDPGVNPLHGDPLQAKVLEREFVEIGVTVARSDEIDDPFYVPIVVEYEPFFLLAAELKPSISGMTRSFLAQTP